MRSSTNARKFTFHASSISFDQSSFFFSSSRRHTSYWRDWSSDVCSSDLSPDQLTASRIIDLATLTGSIIVALGDHRAGLFSNNDEWARRVEEASRRAGEHVWRMPVSDDYKKPIESAIADFKNYGGRPDATAAALLLSKFAGDTPWAHLDIAGTAWHDDPTPFAPKGASGAGVRTLVELVCGR